MCLARLCQFCECHNGLVMNRICSPGGHCWDYCTGTLSYHYFHYYSLGGRVYVDKMYWYPIFKLPHWVRATHICVSKLTIIGSDNCLSPEWRQAIIWTNAGILLIGPLGTNFSGIFIKIYIFSFKKMHLKTSSAKWRPFCPGLNVLIVVPGWYCRATLW